ncbi:MAG: hypothetical protein ACFFD4_31835 [Candidatus Odinarchaeota archaeon]
MECSHTIEPVGDETVISLERDVEVGIQCYWQQGKIFWRVELRLDGSISHARMFINGSDARSFARELQYLFQKGSMPLEKSKLVMI